MVNMGFIMTDESIIPASPSRSDYTQASEYTVPAALNAAEIFDREDPFSLFSEWMTDAREHEVNDSNAMSLATVDDQGLPDVRIVLLKEFTSQGFVFYSNSQSVKGQQIAVSGKAALSFHWKSLRRQVRVRGSLERVSDAVADAYFKSRARGSQIGAWASDQSQVAQSRAELEARVKAAEAEYEGRDVPRPPHWYGWRLEPAQIEFWRDRPYRLHDRLVFRRENSGENWKRERLYP